MNTDEDNLICDLAETYHIYDYRQFNPTYIATLAVGLPDHSRIKRKIANTNLTLEQMLMAQAIDALNTLCWMKTKDAQNGWNRPKSVFQALMGRDKETDIKSFDSSEDFQKAFNAIVGD